MSPRDIFTTAIICALPEETDAVEELLDEPYDRFSEKYGKQKGDPNVYINGRMGKTNVVICQGPGAGKVGAAGVVSSLRLSYTELKLVLVVGICGGLPSRDGERLRSLGDVIISDSIIEYDFGKRHSSGFELKAVAKTQNREVTILLKSLETKKAASAFETQLAANLRKLQAAHKDWLHPKAHPEPGSLATLKLSSPRERNLCMDQVQKDTEMAKIHIGRMASADTVMKSGLHRNALAAKEGVIGFEMEGSGVWDHTTPCIIIKGISDYADRRKNDEWRNYAAATGASAAKAFLVDYWKPASEFRKDHWMVPFERNPVFTGRQQEIKQLEELINSPEGPKKFAVFGLGGIGKTQVVLELAYRMKSKDSGFPVFWVPCTSTESIEQGYINITRALEKDDATSAEAKEHVKAYFSHKVTKWLLILDNVDDSDVWKFLKDILPRSEEGRILITSRSRKVATEAAFSHIMQIPELDEKTALDMLRKKLADKSLLDDENTTTALLDRLAYLPLAITQAAAYLNWNQRCTLIKYLQFLDQQESEAIKLLSTDFMDEGRYAHAPNPVASTWLVSFHQIMDINELAVHYLRLMACVSRHQIPDSFLPPRTSEMEKIDALGLLDAFSFVTANHKTESSTMHRLVRLATRNWMRQNEQFLEYMDKASDRVREMLPRRTESNRFLQQLYLPHAMSLLSEEGVPREDNFRLLWKTAHALSDNCRYREALELFIPALEMRQKYIGLENPNTISSMADLAMTYQKLSQLEKAEEIATQALEISKRVRGEEDEETVFLMATLTSVYQLQGQWDKAEVLGQEMMDIQSRTMPDDLDTLACKKIMGYGNLMQTDNKEGKHAIVEALKAEANVSGFDYLDRLEQTASMAHLTPSKSKVEEAKGLLAEAIKTSVQNDAQVHPRIVPVATRLARICVNLQQPKEAETLASQSLELGIETLGAQHPDTLMAKLALASAYSRQEQWQAAEASLKEVLEDSKVAFGQDAVRISLIMFELWNIFKRQGRHREAESMKAEAIKVRVREDVLGPKNPQVFENMFAFAQVWSKGGKKEDARQIMTRAVRLATEALGPEDQGTKRYTVFLDELQKETDAASTAAANPSRLESKLKTSRLRDRLIPERLLGKGRKVLERSRK